MLQSDEIQKSSYKKVALINDLSGYGRCSTAVMLPIVSHLGVQGCPLPTAIFSNHTGFKSFFRDDYTDRMPAYIAEWQKLGLHFDGITSGFLGSERQIAIVRHFISVFKRPDTLVLIDPVMGDNGHIYPTYTRRMCDGMRDLVHGADLITPNLTEACLLTETPYKERGWTRKELAALAEKLRSMGARQVVVTGIKMGDDFIANLMLNGAGRLALQRQRIVSHVRSGTGDVFAAVLLADSVKGVPLETSVRRASSFVKNCMEITDRYDVSSTDGLCFEEALGRLRP